MAAGTSEELPRWLILRDPAEEDNSVPCVVRSGGFADAALHDHVHSHLPLAFCGCSWNFPPSRHRMVTALKLQFSCRQGRWTVAQLSAPLYGAYFIQRMEWRAQFLAEKVL